MFVAVDHCIPSLFQQEMAKGQKKNKWSMSSSIVDVHMTQTVLGWKWKWRLSSMAFVFSLSTSRSHAKKLDSLGAFRTPQHFEDW